MNLYLKNLVLAITLIMLVSCGNNTEEKEKSMNDKIAQFSKTEIKYDESLLDKRQKVVVQKLYQAAKIIDELFLEQVYSKNFEIRTNLINSTNPENKLTLDYYNIMFGPFDRLDHEKPFYGNKEKPLGANYYPENMTKEEFENWIKANPEDEKKFTSEFTVIRRVDDKLTAVPYSEAYKEKLTKIAEMLNEAASYADNPSLKKYLTLRAKAFSTNDYYESDMAWMDLKDHTIEVIIGPYEVYEDALFNYKAAFECFITLVDPVESKKLQMFEKYLDDMEKNLPIPDEHKNFERGSESPIVVVQEVFSAGDTKAGVQTLAFNLPNDERVRKAKGSKKVMLKNIHEAKFEKLLYPIAQLVMDKDQLDYITFDAFFNHTLMHEISHGLGPGYITVNGKKTEVKKELKETYSKLEECKADILGMWNNIYMIKKGVYPPEFEKQVWSTFLGGVFRSVRFGINEAHGAGTAVIYNFLLEKGGYEFDNKSKTVKVNYDNIYKALKELTTKVLMIQAEGDYNGAKELLAKYAVASESMTILIEKLKNLPVDIRPEFQIAKEQNN